MDKVFFEQEVEKALRALQEGKTILYPTDTVWGIGCDAMNETAIAQVFKIKEREDSKSMIVLVADERDIIQYVASPDLAVFHFIQNQTRPTTVIFDHALHFPENLVAADGSIAIRIVQDEFCRQLIKRFRKPIVSTSANISGEATPKFFNEITTQIKERVDHVVRWRQQDQTPAQPSQIIKWNGGEPVFIRS